MFNIINGGEKTDISIEDEDIENKKYNFNENSSPA